MYFLYTPDMDILWYIIIFWLTFTQISFFLKKNFFSLFFSKKIKFFFENFLFEMLVNYFWNTALVKISWYVFQKWWIFIANWKFSKKNFFGKKWKKNFFGKNWFVNKYLAFIKNWWYIIKLHSLVYMKTYFWHHFMSYKMEKKFWKKKIRKKKFLKKS